MRFTTKHPAKLMLWSFIAQNAVGGLHFIDGTLDSDDYFRIQRAAQPQIKIDLFKERSFVFLQDNTRCHASKKSKSWLHGQNVTSLDWPAQSPDPNPIEHLWALMKKHLHMLGQTKAKKSFGILPFFNSRKNNCTTVQINARKNQSSNSVWRRSNGQLNF